MRLIDLDELMKFPIRLDHYDKENGNEHYVFGVEAVLEYAEYLPTIDAVEVVRCKDCKHQEACTRLVTEVIYDPVLKENVCYHHQMEYCSYGERRTDHESL